MKFKKIFYFIKKSSIIDYNIQINFKKTFFHRNDPQFFKEKIKSLDNKQSIKGKNYELENELNNLKNEKKIFLKSIRKAKYVLYKCTKL